MNTYKGFGISIMLAAALFAAPQIGRADTLPTNFTASQGTSNFFVQLNWNWSGPANVQCLIVKNYTQDLSTAFFAGNAPCSQGFQWDFTNPISGTPFYYWIFAQDSSAYVGPAWGYASGMPSTPANLQATMYQGHATLSWIPNIGGLWYYRIYRSEGNTAAGCQHSNFIKRVLGNVSNSTWTYDTTAVSGHTYTYAMTAVTPTGESACSNFSTLTVQY